LPIQIEFQTAGPPKPNLRQFSCLIQPQMLIDSLAV
jgi:hypothetical protein